MVRPAGGPGERVERASAAVIGCAYQNGNRASSGRADSATPPCAATDGSSAEVSEGHLFLPAGEALLEIPADPLVELHRLLVDRGADRLRRLLEMRHRDLLRFLVLPQRDHRGLAAQALDVRPGVPLELDRELLDVNPFQGHFLRVNLQDLMPGSLVRHGDEDDPIVAARPQEGGVHHVRSVRRPDHDDALHALEAVEAREELVHDPLAHPAVRVEPPAVRDRVDLVEEDDARRDLLRLLEDHPDRLLALPDPLRHHLGAFDRDEVRLALGGDRLREERLPGPRGSVQEDPAGRADSHPLERLGILEGHLHRLLELQLHVVEAANVPPRDVGHLDEDLPHRARLDLLQRALEVLVEDPHLLQDLRGNRLLEVDVREVPPQRLHRGLPCEGREVRADEPVGHVREVGEQAVPLLFRPLDRHPSRVDLEDLLPPDAVRDPDLDLAVEPSGPPECGIDRLVPVRRADHDDLPATAEAVHEGEELRDDPPLHFARDLFSPRRDGVELVDEQDRGRVLLGLLEFLPETFLGLAVVLRHDLRALDRIEVRARLVRDGFRDQRLPRARRAEQKDALRRVDSEPLEQLRVLQRELDHLADLAELLLEPADVLVRDRRGEDLALADGLLLPLDDRVVDHLDDAFRHHLDHHERQGASHQRYAGDDHDVALREGTLQEPALHEVLDPLTETDLVSLRDDRGDRHALRGEHVRLLHLDLVADRDADVPPDEAVDPDDPLALVLLHHAEQLRRGGLLPDDLDDLADVHAEGHPRLRVHPGAAEPHVRLRSFSDLENHPFGHQDSKPDNPYKRFHTIVNRRTGLPAAPEAREDSAGMAGPRELAEEVRRSRHAPLERQSILGSGASAP